VRGCHRNTRMDLHGAALGALGGALLAWLARRDGGTQLACAILLPLIVGYYMLVSTHLLRTHWRPIPNAAGGSRIDSWIDPPST
jgi:hypothetical protein